MTIAELIALAKARKINDEEIDAVQRRMKEAEEKFEAKAQAAAGNSDFMSRSYSL
jgi:hypothetical protein